MADSPSAEPVSNHLKPFMIFYYTPAVPTNEPTNSEHLFCLVFKS
jgi:hypothetical protein